ncbi:MAG TPA: SRPBCC domain-containing protein [Steroidobacteraceae bacterium]|nr:SRPBCC domain-containing protein [Steroidobacteraceae bacterium]
MEKDLPHRLERSVLIQADARTVFRFFTDNARWARWWGAGSSIEPRPGGRVSICYPNGARASGEVLTIEAPERLVFSFGYESGNPIPPGVSCVTIRLEPQPAGTRLHLAHSFAEAAVRDQHHQGWRFQLSLFANAVAEEAFANAAAVVDAWFEAWTVADDAARRAAFEKIALPTVRFSDRYGALESVDDIVEHAGATLRFMPGATLERNGQIRHCQGSVLANWASGAGTGTNLFVLAPDGRIAAVVGFQDEGAREPAAADDGA